MQNKCYIFIIFLCLSSIGQAQDVTPHIDFLLQKLYDRNENDYVMIFAHRGDWRNAPENSLQGYRNCIDGGIDGVEIDIQETKDGELVILHDNTLDRTTTGSGLVREKTFAEIEKLFLKNSIGVKTRHKIPTYRQVLRLCKGKILIQVDKWQKSKNKVLQLAKEEGCLKQIILRGTYDSKKVKELLGSYLDQITYIPVLVAKGKGDDEKLDDYLQNIASPVISLSFKNDTMAILNRIDEIKGSGHRLWLNTMWAEFNGGHDDEMAEYDLENSYGWLLQKGGNIIFSDRPFLLSKYLKEKLHR